MKWLAHQRAGFFGLDAARKGTPQPAHAAVVDLDEACLFARPYLEMWGATRSFPGAQPWGGGVMEWPARESEALAVLNGESAAVDAYLMAEGNHG